MRLTLTLATLSIALSVVTASAQGDATPKPGQTVDSRGNAAVDPTKNVLDLVLAAVKRLDDLMELSLKRQDDLRVAQATLEQLRYDGIKENASLRADYEDRLRKGEASRLDAIRLVDTTNLSVDRERAASTALALQKKGDDSALVLSAAVVKSADDIRNIVKTTADEQARNLATLLGGIQTQFTDTNKRLTSLEQAGAEGLGKQKFADPAQIALTAAVQKLIEAQSAQVGSGAGSGQVIAYVMSGFMLLLILIGTVVGVITVSGNKTRSRG